MAMKKYCNKAEIIKQLVWKEKQIYILYKHKCAHTPSNFENSQCKTVFINELHVLRSIKTLFFECSAAIINKRYPKHKAAQRLTIKVDRTDLMYLKKKKQKGHYNIYSVFYCMLKILEPYLFFCYQFHFL